MRISLQVLAIGLLAGCQSKQETPSDSLFQKLSANETHVNFANTVTDDKDFNIFNYRNFYNGGGVAIADVNNDGFADVVTLDMYPEDETIEKSSLGEDPNE